MQFEEDRLKQPSYLKVGRRFTKPLGEELSVKRGSGLSPKQVRCFALLALENARELPYEFDATVKRKGQDIGTTQGIAPINAQAGR